MKMSILTRKGHWAVVALLATSMAVSCKKDDAAPNTVTEEEAVEVMTESVSETSGGLSQQTADAARVAQQTYLSCGQTKDTVIAKSNAPGAAVTWNYNATISRSLTCNDVNVPSTFTFSYAGGNTYDAPRMSSDDKTTAGFTITGIEPSAPDYIFNQQYVRVGTQQSKVRLQRSFSSTLTITSSNVVYNKANGMISSGTASITFDAAVSGGKTISHAATLTFKGNRQGTLVFKNGNSYDISW